MVSPDRSSSRTTAPGHYPIARTHTPSNLQESSLAAYRERVQLHTAASLIVARPVAVAEWRAWHTHWRVMTAHRRIEAASDHGRNGTERNTHNKKRWRCVRWRPLRLRLADQRMNEAALNRCDLLRRKGKARAVAGTNSCGIETTPR